MDVFVRSSLSWSSSRLRRQVGRNSTNQRNDRAQRSESGEFVNGWIRSCGHVVDVLTVTARLNAGGYRSRKVLYGLAGQVVKEQQAILATQCRLSDQQIIEVVFALHDLRVGQI